MYPNTICKATEKSIENYRKNEENYVSGHGLYANKTRHFYEPFSVEYLTNSNDVYNSSHK